MTAATPLRQVEPAPLPAIDSDAEPYAAHLLAIVERTDDLASWSDELALAAPMWPDSYHLHPARANVLRTLPIPSAAAVLEIGARAGGLTRYLGEAATTVDALELDPALAAVAAARTADLDSVKIRIGWIDSVPDEPAYDLIVAVDVLNEIDDHGLTLTAFVTRCRSMLRPGGLLVIAADNTESVGAVLGGRTPRVPVPSGRVASVSPRALLEASDAAGLRPVTLSAFPDHRHTQLLFSHSQLASLGHHLLSELPKFSVPPGASNLLDPSAQEHEWRSMVAEGTAEDHAGSVVVLAGMEQPVLDDVATFWTVGRAAAQSACNRVRLDGDEPVIARTRAFPHVPDTGLALRLRTHSEPVVDGSSITHLLIEETDLARVQELLVAWYDFVGAAEIDGSVPWDLIPRNVMLRPDGSMCAIDQEWQLDGANAETVRARGLFWLAHELVQTAVEPAWLVPGTVGRTAQRLRRLAGADPDPFWVDEFIDREAEDASWVAPTSPRQTRAFHARKNRGALMSISDSRGHQQTSASDHAPATPESMAAMRSMLAAADDENEVLREKIRALELEKRHLTLVQRDHVLGLTAELEMLRDRWTRSREGQRRSREKAAQLQKTVTSMRRSRTWRVGRMIMAPFARLRGSSSS